MDSQKADDFERRCEEYMTRVFPTIDLESTGTVSASPDIDTIAQMKRRLPDHQKYGRILESERGFELITYVFLEYAIECGSRFVHDF